MARYQAMRPFIEGLKSDAHPVKILDVGSGEGYLHHFLSDLVTEFWGIECDETRFQTCQSMGYQMNNFNVEKQPFPYENDFFDAVVASHIIEHLYHPEIALKELYRVLKPGGVIIIGVPMQPWLVSKILHLKEKLFPTVWWGHHQFFCMSSLRKFLHNLQVEDIRGFRLFSARQQLTLEDKLWFYKISTWFGKRFPNLSPEINAVIRKPHT